MAVDKSAWIKACDEPTIYCVLLLYMAVEKNKSLSRVRIIFSGVIREDLGRSSNS